MIYMVNNINITSTTYTTPAVLGSAIEFVATLVHNLDSEPLFTLHAHVDGAVLTTEFMGEGFSRRQFVLAADGTWDR